LFNIIRTANEKSGHILKILRETALFVLRKEFQGLPQRAKSNSQFMP